MDFEVEVSTGLENLDSETVELEHDDAEPTESGGGRYAKNMVGFSVDVKVVKNVEGKDQEVLWEEAIKDEAAASEYEEQA